MISEEKQFPESFLFLFGVIPEDKNLFKRYLWPNDKNGGKNS